ncbi:hypothetical protein CAPTEDRAFT_191108 [Capitella teleta]|uniref:Uncharacterized protein n=1 Tax=Capitella teleta TaxID=283909 RepID=R7UXF1_CAPTE|nr:hypothetical protein CAPTEDRAFT_191108 [Capitella teleta]|eukprot:ELU08592.1 hypothetical protein CAPTEDRAFT_191108 [Capitella teleta]
MSSQLKDNQELHELTMFRALLKCVCRNSAAIIYYLALIVFGLLVLNARNLNYFLDKGSTCKFFNAEAKLERDYVENIFQQAQVNSIHDVTLVTQLTISRVGRLEQVLDKWKGPVSAAFHVDESPNDVIQAICDNKVLSNRNNLYIHLMRKTGRLYPINQLRNLALKCVSTGFSFLSDVDFIPHQNLYNESKQIVSKNIEGSKKRAYVVAAFGVQEAKGTNKAKAVEFPESKEKLLKLWDSKMIEPVHFAKFIHGHYQTNYTRWRNATEIYPIQWYTHYEPYVIVKTTETPAYDGTFIERYFDKVSHIFHLHKAGFDFWGIPNVYIVHMPHSSSKKNMSRYLRCATLAYEEFVAKLDPIRLKKKQ